MIPAAAADMPNATAVSAAPAAPQAVNVSVYVVDFNRFDVGAGSVGADFYLDIASDSPVSIDDFELMNGQITSISTVSESPEKKEYRIIALLTTEPDLSRYPFDRHTLRINLEPKLKNEQEINLTIDRAASGLDNEADLPGWQITDKGSYITTKSYLPGEVPYPRAVFEYGIVRDQASTILKFFLPIMLIVIVSLSSLLMKVSSRLGLNASMFLAAVLIHWRIADAIPLVAYATFLDLFMIITYATLVMVLISGVLILMYSETGNKAAIDRVDYWSKRFIPAVSVTLYLLLFLTILV